MGGNEWRGKKTREYIIHVRVGPGHGFWALLGFLRVLALQAVSAGPCPGAGKALRSPSPVPTMGRDFFNHPSVPTCMELDAAENAWKQSRVMQHGSGAC